MEVDLTTLEKLPGGVYRMVQLYIDGEPYLYFTNADTYARNVLTAILNCHKLDYEVVRLRHSIGPASTGKRYSACGMGTATCVEGDKKLVTLSGYSIDYGLYVNEKHLELIKKGHPDVEFFITNYQ